VLIHPGLHLFRTGLVQHDSASMSWRECVGVARSIRSRTWRAHSRVQGRALGEAFDSVVLHPGLGLGVHAVHRHLRMTECSNTYVDILKKYVDRLKTYMSTDVSTYTHASVHESVEGERENLFCIQPLLQFGDLRQHAGHPVRLQIQQVL
jgi:hypothetical protein